MVLDPKILAGDVLDLTTLLELVLLQIMRPIKTWRGSTELTERRRTPRATLQWTVYLAINGSGHPFRATTRDINKDGFYCSLDQPVKPGERIECDIVVPTHGAQDSGDVVYLRCCALAVRVEKIEGSLEFGLACRIEGYGVIRSSGSLPDCRKDAGLVRNWPADPVKLLPN